MTSHQTSFCAATGGWLCATSIAFLLLVSLGFTANATAQETQPKSADIGGMSEPSKRLAEINKRRKDRNYVIPSQPLENLQKSIDSFQDKLYGAIGLNLGLAVNHLFQGTTAARPDTDDLGMASTAVLVGKLDLVNRDTPSQGEVIFGVEARWDYGTTGPETIGFGSVGSGLGTGDTFAAYEPNPIILREVFWRQGSPEAGWSYRIGKITPDGLLATSEYFDSTTAFLPTGSTGSNAIAFPDSGLGLVTAIYPHPRFRMFGLISDANADRTDFGNINEGDLFTAVEFQAQIAPPQTKDAGYSTLTFWNNPGTANGEPINGSSGLSGWGFFLKHEQELSEDGRHVGILRYGKSFDDSAILYKQQASIHYVQKNPPDPIGLENDMLGIAVNWIDPTIDDARDEYDFEVFYRMPLFPTVDTSFAYQAIIDPAFNPEDDLAHVFSFRLRKTF